MIYFIGCGPGDRKLITLRGEETLKKCSIIFYFPPYDKVFSDLVENKPKYMYFNHEFENIVEIIDNNKDKNIAFLVPGDLAIFSPFSCFLNYYRDNIEIIPGVGVFSYFSAKLKKILNPAGTIYSVTFLSTKLLGEKLGEYSFSDFLHRKTTLIIYMNILKIDELVDKLKEVYNENTSIYIGINLSLKDEKIFSGTLANIEKKLPFDISVEKFATIIVGDIKEMPLNIKWWNEKIKSYRIK